ncbi:agamous-like MADS-box protein AGL80 [Sesbania bispinosa]|nr:agamous-like MADS-box protein AGL80 [Sesbania bispinosa]
MKKEVSPNLEGAKEVNEKYKNTYVIEESKNVNQESFLMQRIAETQNCLKKVRQDNREKELTMVMLNCMRDKSLPNMPFEDANDLKELIEKSLNDIEIKLSKLN